MLLNLYKFRDKGERELVSRERNKWMQLTDNSFDGKSIIYKTCDDLRSMILLPFDGIK